MSKINFKRVSVNLSAEEYHNLRREAARLEISMSNLIRTLVKSYWMECELRQKRNLNSANPKRP